MAMAWAVFFISGFLCTCTSAQYIYVNENDDCPSNVEAVKKIRGLLMQQRRILESVDSLRQMVQILNENMTRIHKDVQIVKEELNLDVVDCQDLSIKGNRESGEYTIYPFGIQRPVNVYCDMVTEGGGWTAIQERLDGSVSFDRTWAENRNGFGYPNDSYWIGNDIIHHLTKGRNSYLYVVITLLNGTKLYEMYNQFSVADEANKYRLFLGGPAKGTLGDAMIDTGYPDIYDLSGMYFSTPDRDNDGWSTGNCAAYFGRRGGWWLNSCHFAFLNGKWYPGDWRRPWYPTVESRDSKEIKETLMMIKRH